MPVQPESRATSGLIDMLCVFSQQIVGLRARRSHDHRRAREQADIVGIAPDFLRCVPDVANGAGEHWLGLPIEEDRLCMPRRKGAAAFRGAGLVQERRALRRRFGEVNDIDPVVRSVVPDGMNRRRIREDARCAIATLFSILKQMSPEVKSELRVTSLALRPTLTSA